jgi:hypothetical protein
MFTSALTRRPLPGAGKEWMYALKNRAIDEKDIH